MVYSLDLPRTQENFRQAQITEAQRFNEHVQRLKEENQRLRDENKRLKEQGSEVIWGFNRTGMLVRIWCDDDMFFVFV